ncbi:hypothetical protein Q670_12085 [Alcanivorax sp. P2S70]|nr:hypothetical protein Q670_12085 [Alcanivorax sp. P2S70]
MNVGIVSPLVSLRACGLLAIFSAVVFSWKDNFFREK